MTLLPKQNQGTCSKERQEGDDAKNTEAASVAASALSSSLRAVHRILKMEKQCNNNIVIANTDFLLLNTIWSERI